MVVFWSRLWLDPEDIEEDDGSPEIIPYMLMAYHTLATGNTELDPGALMPSESGYSSSEIPLRVAELQGLKKTPMWHARVAQTLRSRLCYQEALDHFQISLDKHQNSPSLSMLSLFVIHRDISRTLKKLGRHKEALSHFDLSDSLRKDLLWDNKPKGREYVANLLNAAQMKHLAKLPDNALATADEAFEFARRNARRNDGKRFYPDLISLFVIFLELYQPHRIRSVLDFAFTYHQTLPDSQSLNRDFLAFVLQLFGYRPHIMFRIFHLAVTSDDQHYLDTISGMIERFDTQTLDWDAINVWGIGGRVEFLSWELNNLAHVKYMLATFLFDKGRVSQGIQGWYEVAALSEPVGDWDIDTPRKRSICELAALCLSDAEIPYAERSALALDDDAGYSDVCLVISSWLRDHGDVIHARDALRGRVQRCISLLSDDDPSNDIVAFVSLFMTFLVARDNDADLEAALHLVKLDDERELKLYGKEKLRLNILEDDTKSDLSESLDQVRLTDARVGDEDVSVDTSIDDVRDVNSHFSTDYVIQCSSCKADLRMCHWWYFCRSCPNKGLCQRCYRQQFRAPALANPDDAASSTPDKTPAAVCDIHHEFYYTGTLLRPDEHVPNGMVPVASTTGERQEIWIEEWKDRLAEEWETADFEFEGGLSAWCLRVLPEPQRTRWATFFGP